MRIIRTDNFGRDYPVEFFLEPLPSLPGNICEQICYLINGFGDDNSEYFYRTVENDYKLSKGFEP